MNTRDQGISFGIGLLTGLRGTPLWVNAGVTVAVNEVARSNPEVIGQPPRDGDTIIADVTVSAIGWMIGQALK